MITCCETQIYKYTNTQELPVLHSRYTALPCTYNRQLSNRNVSKNHFFPLKFNASRGPGRSARLVVKNCVVISLSRLFVAEPQPSPCTNTTALPLTYHVVTARGLQRCR
jgi:hypothetical protein